jgi:nitrous oxidase accessory protein
MRSLGAAFALVALCAAASAQTPAPQPLQALIDATPDGGVLRLSPGVYLGPATIDRPMTIDGGHAATIDGQGVGTVIIVSGSQVSLQGLKIGDSGKRHEVLDSCLRLDKATFVVVKDDDFDGCLIGVDLRQSNSNVIRDNRIHGTEPELDIRGDAMRVWESNDNRIERNVISDHRDVLFEYSTHNRLIGNTISGGRYGTHFMNSGANLAQGNVYVSNSVGLFSMYSDDLCLIGNRVARAIGPAGVGIGLKEASRLTIENNEVLGNAIGLYNDGSPFEPDSTNAIRGNRFAFNAIAVEFHTNTPGNLFERNTFQNNYSNIAAQGGNGATASNWRGNYWDDYQGFERRKPGVGDTPYEIYAYADRLWSDVPMTGFYRGSPVFEAIDFLARLAPFTEPRLVLRDAEPLTRLPAAAPPDCGSKDDILAR